MTDPRVGSTCYNGAGFFYFDSSIVFCYACGLSFAGEGYVLTTGSFLNLGTDSFLAGGLIGFDYCLAEFLTDEGPLLASVERLVVTEGVGIGGFLFFNPSFIGTDSSTGVFS